MKITRRRRGEETYEYVSLVRAVRVDGKVKHETLRGLGGRMILVTGSHRSGTTWVGHMLDASGQTGYIYEPFNPVMEPSGLCPAPFKGFTYIHAGNEQVFERPIERMLAFEYDLVAATRTLRGRGIRRRLREARNTRRFRRSGVRPLVKDPIAVFSAEWLADRFGMDVLVMIRHPAAFVGSVLRMGWTHDFGEFLEQEALMREHLEPYRAEIETFVREPRDQLDQAALAWKLIHHMIVGYQERRPDWLFVRHEDLSARPLVEFERIYHALDLEWTTEARDVIARHSSAANPAEAPKGVGTHLKRDSAAAAENWRRRLAPEQVVRIRDRVEPVSSHFYDASSW